jgi:hypothetical protein
VKPLTRYNHALRWCSWEDALGSQMLESDEGRYYAKDEADAKFAELEAENLHTENLYAREIERRKDAEAERDAAREDAERYRWLRRNANPGFAQSGKAWSVLVATVEVRTWDGMDAAIDAARGKE